MKCFIVWVYSNISYVVVGRRKLQIFYFSLFLGQRRIIKSLPVVILTKSYLFLFWKISICIFMIWWLILNLKQCFYYLTFNLYQHVFISLKIKHRFIFIKFIVFWIKFWKKFKFELNLVIGLKFKSRTKFPLSIKHKIGRVPRCRALFQDLSMHYGWKKLFGRPWLRNQLMVIWQIQITLSFWSLFGRVSNDFF